MTEFYEVANVSHVAPNVPIRMEREYIVAWERRQEFMDSLIADGAAIAVGSVLFDLSDPENRFPRYRDAVAKLVSSDNRFAKVTAVYRTDG